MAMDLSIASLGQDLNNNLGCSAVVDPSIPKSRGLKEEAEERVRGEEKQEEAVKEVEGSEGMSVGGLHQLLGGLKDPKAEAPGPLK